MKKSLAFFITANLLSSACLAAPMDGNCVINQTCSYRIYSHFNKIIHTYDIQSGKEYRCHVLSNNGKYFNINNIQSSPGVRYKKGKTFDEPFILDGPKEGVGAISYTLHNNDDDIFTSHHIEYICEPSQTMMNNIE